MRRKFIWAVICSLMVLSLIITACGQTTSTTSQTTQTPQTTQTSQTTPTTQVTQTNATPTTTVTTPVSPSNETPIYGGTLNLVLASDPVRGFDPSLEITSYIIDNCCQQLWEGDWTKGPAGGYGTAETDWLGDNDIFGLKAGYIAESWKWSTDAASNSGTLVYQIRQGIHYSLNPAMEASKLVNGRELTADDVLYCFTRAITSTTAYLYGRNVELRTANITKTGPREITIRVPISSLCSAISRFGDAVYIYPPELVAKYGNMNSWQRLVGSGAFMINEYVPASSCNLKRNPNFWMKDPIGPGKGNQLPYLDGMDVFIIPDTSTQYAAMRTGKLDQIGPLAYDQAQSLKQPKLKELVTPSHQGRGTPMFMRIDKAPFTDVKVRRAMNMAIDFRGMLKGLYGDKGDWMTWPYAYTKDYAGILVRYDEPGIKDSVKELFTYNPEGAKKLLAEAGYPNGLKTSVLLPNTSANVDYYSIIKDYLSKVGVTLTLDIREPVVVSNIQLANTFEQMTTYTTSPAATWWQGAKISGDYTNFSQVHDPFIDKTMQQIMTTMLTDEKSAMAMYKDLIKNYVLDQAYVVPNVQSGAFYYWWPWLKNYSGEYTVGYDDPIWPQYIWADTAMKASMGY